MTEWHSNKYWRNRSPEDRMQNARIPARFKGKHLSEYDTKTGDKEAFDAVSHWVSSVNDRLEDGMGLYLYGPTGVGKTHLAQAALTKVLKDNNISGVFITADRYLDMIYDEQFHKGELPDAYSDPNLLKYMRRVFDIVVLDGLGSERVVTEFAKKQIISLLDNRYEEKLITVITSVVPPQELTRMYGQRLNSLLQDSCFFINVDGKDHRTAFTNAG
jgi:DNA replication protein DnaC